MSKTKFVTIVNDSIGAESQVLPETVRAWESAGWKVKDDSSKPSVETTSKQNVTQSDTTDDAPAPLQISATQED